MVKIFLDPGHGGVDGGAGTRPYLEKELTLTIALRLRAYLQTNFTNVTVYLSRTEDTTLTLNQRTDHANRVDADFLLSIHFNAAVLGSARGYEDYCYTTISDGSTSEKIRTAIHNEVVNRVLTKYGITNRGKKKANFHMVRESNMPAVLVETLFVSNTTDQALIRNAHYMNDIVEAYGEGLARGLGLNRKPAPAPAPKPTNTINSGALYRVQVGAFSSEANAEAMETRLKRAGFPAYIYRSNGLYRVQVGAFGSKANADNMQTRVKKAGFPCFIYRG